MKCDLGARNQHNTVLMVQRVNSHFVKFIFDIVMSSYTSYALVRVRLILPVLTSKNYFVYARLSYFHRHVSCMLTYIFSNLTSGKKKRVSYASPLQTSLLRVLSELVICMLTIQNTHCYSLK